MTGKIVDIRTARPREDEDGDQSRKFTSEKLNWLDCVVRDHRLKPGAFKVAFVIMQHVGSGTGIAYPSDETIAAISGISRPQVQRHRESLRNAGWLSWERTQNSNRYTPLFHKVNAALDEMAIQQDRRRELRELRIRMKALKAAEGRVPVPHGRGT